MVEYRIVIDQSTSGTKVLLFYTENNVEILSRVDLSHRQIYPKKGWVEHDPNEIVNNVKYLIDQTLNKNNLTPKEIKSISITNQRESIVIWNRKTGELYTNVMVWQCNRGLEICQDLIDNDYNEMIAKKTGLTIDPYFSASKLKWFFDSHDLDSEEIANLGVGTIETWLIWNLTNGEKYVSEISNASRTLLYNIFDNQWDPALLGIFNVPQDVLPAVVDSVSDFGRYLDIPIASVVADSQSALLGHGCVTAGSAKATLGTGCSILVNAGNQVDVINKNILTTIAWKKDNQNIYALEGVIRSFGDVLNWMKDTLKLFNDVETASKIALSLEDNDGVYFVPALEGLGAPFWLPDLEASFKGMTRSTTQTHLIRAGFESLAYQIKAVVEEFETGHGIVLEQIYVDGGASKNEAFMQMIADVTDKTIITRDIEEASALGSLAVLGERVKSFENKKFVPQKSYNTFYKQWVKIIKTIENN